MGEKNTGIGSARDLLDYETARPWIRSSLTNESNLKEHQVKAPVCADVWKTYFVELPAPKDRRIMSIIGKDLLALWSKTVDDLNEAAAENEQGTATIVNMSEILGFGQAGIEMYVVSNLEGWNGAPAILEPAVQKRLEELFPEGYAVLPSSIHEVIALPQKAASGASWIVKSVNATNAVREHELLSDHVFQVENGKLTVLE